MIFLMISAMAGVAMSALFFGGLWWTVRDIEEREHPAALMMASFVVRTAIVLAGFYAIGQFGWEGMGVAAATFVATRFAVTRVLGPTTSPSTADAGGSTWS
jgi:F1F0 ATPase subunit 2